MSIAGRHSAFAERLKDARLHAAARRRETFPEAEVARLVGLSKQAYAHYEEGRSRPSREVEEMLAAVLGVNVTWLVYGRGEREAGPIPPEVGAMLAAVRELEEAAKKPASPKRRRPRRRTG